MAPARSRIHEGAGFGSVRLRGHDASIQAAATNAAARGLTLVEMLVVLVLVSLLGTLVLQGTGFFLDQFATVERIHRDASRTDLRNHWFASTVGAILPSRQAERRFVGESTYFEGVTLQPLAAASGQPSRIRWSIEGDRVLFAESGRQPWTILGGFDTELSFQYAGLSRQWHDWWSPEETREYIPRMVRLVSSDGRILWLARFELHPEPVANYREEF